MALALNLLHIETRPGSDHAANIYRVGGGDLIRVIPVTPWGAFSGFDVYRWSPSGWVHFIYVEGTETTASRYAAAHYAASILEETP